MYLSIYLFYLSCYYQFTQTFHFSSSQVRGGEERVEIARGVDKVKVSLALQNIKPPVLTAALSDANDNSKSALDVSNRDSSPPSDAHSVIPTSDQFRREFVGFTGGVGYRHKWLVRAPEMEPIVRDFVGA